MNRFNYFMKTYLKTKLSFTLFALCFSSHSFGGASLPNLTGQEYGQKSNPTINNTIYFSEYPIDLSTTNNEEISYYFNENMIILSINKSCLLATAQRELPKSENPFSFSLRLEAKNCVISQEDTISCAPIKMILTAKNDDQQSKNMFVSCLEDRVQQIP